MDNNLIRTRSPNEVKIRVLMTLSSRRRLDGGWTKVTFMFLSDRADPLAFAFRNTFTFSIRFALAFERLLRPVFHVAFTAVIKATSTLKIAQVMPFGTRRGVVLDGLSLSLSRTNHNLRIVLVV